MDKALAAGSISVSLPYIKKEGVELLKASYATNEEANSKLPAALANFYQQKYPDVYAQRTQDINQAGQAVLAIYNRNVFPDLKVTWGTYPNNLGHMDFPGCFRCHDGSHTSSGGKRSLKTVMPVTSRWRWTKRRRKSLRPSLEGDYRPEHLFALRRSLAAYRYYQQLVLEPDREIQRQMAELEAADIPLAKMPKRTKHLPYQRQGTGNERIRQQRDIRIFHRFVDAQHLGVRLGIDQTGEAVAGICPTSVGSRN
jgi:hypothetical protein